MNPGLLIFTQIAIAGCGFLVYFLFALWREARKRPKIEIRRNTTAMSENNVIQLYPAKELRGREVRRARR